jgi:hypothetical protein
VSISTAARSHLVGGYWIIRAKDREEAVEWARRVPLGGDAFVEVRRLQELSDLPEDIQQAAQLSQCGRRRASRTTRAPGSWPRPSTARSI